MKRSLTKKIKKIANNKKINQDLVSFWDASLTLPEDYKSEYQNVTDLDYKELAPSEKLLEAVVSLGNCSKVLDYGCRDGWASIAANKSGCKDVVAVDLGENIIKTALFYAKLCNSSINAQCVDANWLGREEIEKYDGIICSNVLDVLPLETSLDIIKNLARVAKKNAKIIIGLNFYISKEVASTRGMNLVEDKYLYVDNVLRLLSLSDDEWSNLFAPYFEIEKLDYFAWPGEKSETRRLFYLLKK